MVKMTTTKMTTTKMAATTTINMIKNWFKGKPEPKVEYTGVTSGMWDAELLDTDISYWDPIQRLYSPQDSSFRYPFGLYDEMYAKNTHIQSCLNTRVKSTLAKQVIIIPADKSVEAQNRAKFVAEVIQNAGFGLPDGNFPKLLNSLQLRTPPPTVR